MVPTCTHFSWNIFRITRRPASADRTARRQFQATGQPASRTQACDAMTSRLPRYEAKCATQVLPMRVGLFASIYQGNGATPSQYIDTTRKAIDCAITLRYNYTCWKFASPVTALRSRVIYILKKFNSRTLKNWSCLHVGNSTCGKQSWMTGTIYSFSRWPHNPT